MREYAKLFYRAVEAALAGATVVTENKRASRQIMTACERRLQATQQAWKTPDVLPFDAWLQRVWRDCMLSGATNLVLLRPLQQRALWEKIVAASPVGGELVNPHSAAGEAAEAWRLLHQYGIALTPGPFQATLQTRAFYEWAQTYRATCTSQGWTDTPRAASEIGGLLRAITALLPKRIVFFGFDAMTPQQQRLRQALGDCGIEVQALLPDDWPIGQRAVCVEAPDARAELYAAASWARGKLLANPASRAAVIVPDLGSLRADAEWIFTQVLHPEALLIANREAPRAFDISLGPNLSAYPIINAALLALRLAAGAIPTDEASALIRSPYIGGGMSEAGARGVFDVFLRSRAGAEVAAAELKELLEHRENPTGTPSRSAGPAVGRCGSHCPELYRRISSVFHSLEATALTPSQWAGRIGELLQAIGWPGDGHPLDSSEYQACTAWSELLSDFSALDVLVSPLPPTQMAAEIKRLADDKVFKPENASAPVQIMGPLEAAGSVFDHLWFCGLSDDAWPTRGHPNAFLPLALQCAAGVPHCLPVREFAFARRVSARLIESAEGEDEIVFSWPRRREDQQLRRSPVLEGMATAAIDTISADPPWSWSLRQRGIELETVASDEPAPVEPCDVHPGGTRVFELQSNCPFRAFAQLRLSAEQIEQPEAGIRTKQRGQVIEKALELVWGHLREQFTLHNISAPDLNRIVAGAVTQAMELLPAVRASWETRHRVLERERLIRLVMEWLEVEKRRETFHVESHQQKVLISAGGLTVNGRIDRLDRLNDGSLVVLDYKTGGGNYGPGQWSGPRPERPQLQLYTTQFPPERVSAVAFAQVRTGECGLKGLAARKEILGKAKNTSGQYLEAPTFAEHIAGWKTVLDELGRQFLAGAAGVDPFPEGVCKHCHLPGLCRIAEQQGNPLDANNGGDDDAE